MVYHADGGEFQRLLNDKRKKTLRVVKWLSKWKKPFLSPLGRVLAVGRSIYPLTPQNAKFSHFWACTAKSLNFSKPPKYLLFGAYSILRVYFDGMALCQNWHSSLFKFTKNTQIVIIWGKLAFQKSLLHPECRRAASIPYTGKAICHQCLVPADGGRPAVLTSQRLGPPWSVTLHNLCLVLLSHASLTSPGIGDDLIDVLLLPSILIATCRHLFRSIFYLPASAHCLSPLHDLTSLLFFWAMSPLFFRCKFSASDIWQVPLCSIRIPRHYFYRKFPAAFRISFFTAKA